MVIQERMAQMLQWLARTERMRLQMEVLAPMAPLRVKQGGTGNRALTTLKLEEPAKMVGMR